MDEYSGKQYHMDVHVAYHRACLNVIEYLKKFGDPREQAYLLLSCAPVEVVASWIFQMPVRP